MKPLDIGVVTTRLFDRPESGGEICTVRLLRALHAEGHALHLIGRGSAGAELESLCKRVSSAGPVVDAFDNLSAGRQALSLVRAIVGGEAETVARLGAGGPAGRVQRFFAATGAPRPQLLVVDHLQCWPWIAGVSAPQRPRTLLVMHNLEAAGYAERAAGLQQTGVVAALRRAVLRREARLLSRLERRALEAARWVACLGDDDALAIAAAATRPRSVVVLPGYPTAATPGVAPQRCAARDGAWRIGLIGTWTWAPNRRALDWLLEHVLPLLPAPCELHVAGAGSAALAPRPRLVVAGRVADARAFLSRIDCIALPAFEGSGVQEKAIEAIASGRPVVATPHALRGLGRPLPSNVCIATDAVTFAHGCSARVDPPPAAFREIEHWGDSRRVAYRDTLRRCLVAAV